MHRPMPASTDKRSKQKQRPGNLMVSRCVASVYGVNDKFVANAPVLQAALGAVLLTFPHGLCLTKCSVVHQPYGAIQVCAALSVHWSCV